MNKKTIQEEKEWKRKIDPNIKNSDYLIKRLLSFVSVFFLIFLFFIIIYSIRNRRSFLGIFSLVCFVWTFYSWLSLNPKLHNQLRIQKKIVPIRNDIDIERFLVEILLLETPYGRPTIRQLEIGTLPVPTYIIKEAGYVVFFYIKNQEVVIYSRKLFRGGHSYEQTQRENKVFEFTQSLADLFSFYLNTNRLPVRSEFDKIFKASKR